MNKYKIVVGMGFGDEGKGTMVDYFASTGDYSYVVRFSGGAQAAHNVITPDGRHHTFSQIGAGAFHNTKTILGIHVLFDPFAFTHEAEAFEALTGYDAYNNTYIDRDCLVVTPYHVAVNRMKETARGQDRHGSCGMGVGEARNMQLNGHRNPVGARSIYADDLVAKSEYDSATLGRLRGQQLYAAGVARSLKLNLDDYVDTTPSRLFKDYRFVGQALSNAIVPVSDLHTKIRRNSVIFEGSQGILLDEWRGFHPNTTWSSTTSQNAVSMLHRSGVPQSQIEVVGVSRTYHTRHGAGPFATEFTDHRSMMYPELHNAWGEYQGGWRVGALDMGLLRYAVKSDTRIDSIALTHYDVHSPYIYLSSSNVASPIRSLRQENFERRGAQYGKSVEDRSLTFNHQLGMMDKDGESALLQKGHLTVEGWSDLLKTWTGKPLKYVSSGPTVNEKIEVDSLVRV